MMLILLFCVIKLNFFASAKILIERAQLRLHLALASLLNFHSKVDFSLELVVVEIMSFKWTQ